MFNEFLTSEEKIPEESLQEATKSRRAKFAADTQQLDKLFYERVEQEKFADTFYKALKDAGVNVDEIMSSSREHLATGTKKGVFT